MIKNRKLLGRRSFLLGLGTLTGIGTLVTTDRFRGWNKHIQAFFDSSERDFAIVGDAPLQERAAVKRLIYGAFTQGSYEKFSQDQQFQSSFRQECALLVAGFFWGRTHPSLGVVDFTSTDYLAKFASDNQMLLQGSPLVWHKFNPKWLTDKFKNPNTNSSEIKSILTNYISTAVGRYAGQVHSWIVVNEAIKPEDGNSDGFRNSPWLKFLGPDYIDLAFRTAREADPQALLVYNDNELWPDTPRGQAKKAAVLKLLERLKYRGTPVQALGMQCHLRGDRMDKVDPKKLRTFLADVAALGLKIMITELDVIDHKLPEDIEVRDRLVARAYEDFLSIMLDEPAVMAVITWGLSDRYTWLSKFAPRQDGLPVRPLPLDKQLNPKLAWNAIARAFEHAPMR
ncbi:MAG: endo-1,4-beta-xylanase [Symploca sp. SIO1A3]|nr:endo-1,4-beta-xylanase [Symploca sp. SIO1A3]